MVSHAALIRSDSIELDPAVRPALRVPAWLVWGFGVAIVFTYLCMIGRFGLNEPDEPRYAEIAREMLELRDWVTPHLNYVKYFEKPPLMYWLTAINFQLFGKSEFVVRLWPALFGLLGIVMADVIGRSMYGPWTGHVAAALLATTPFYFGLSQVLLLDMPLSALMAAALGAFWFAYQQPSRRSAFVWLLYIATALAVLTKGPVAALLIAGIILTFVVVQGEGAALRWLLSPVGILLFLAIVVPWFVLVSRRNVEFFDFFVITQHIDRFLRPAEHREPLWFFVPIVIAGMLPWTAFVLLSPRAAVEVVGRLVRRRVSAGALYCIIWGGVVFAFFSLSGSKLATYILPLFCPLAILVARRFHRVIDRQEKDALYRAYVGVLVFGVSGLLAAAVAGAVVDHWRIAIVLPRAYIGAVILTATGALALVFLRWNALQASLASLLAGMLVLQLVAISGRDVAKDYTPLGVAIRQQAEPHDQVVIYRHYVQAIPFHAQRRTVIVGKRGELDFGSRQGDQRDYFWETDAQLFDAWQSPRRIFLVINRVELEPLRAHLHPAPRQIAAHRKKVVVVNFN